MPRVLKSSCAFRLEDDYLRPVHMEKSCPEWKGHLPTRATLSEPPFHTFPYKTRRTVYMHKKLKIGSAGRVTRVNILWWYSGIPSRANFSRYKHFGSPSAGSTRWRRDNQSMRERCSLGQPGQLFFSYTLFKVDSVRRVSLLLAENKFPPFKRDLSFEDFPQFTLKTLPFYR